MGKYGWVKRGQEEAIYNKLVKAAGGDEDVLRRILSDEVDISITEKTKKLLKLLQISSLTLESTPNPFIVATHIRLNINDSLPEGIPRIGFVEKNFINRFSNKVEYLPKREVDFHIHLLTEPSLGGPIIAKLGNITEAGCWFIWTLLCKQYNGGNGVLLTNGHANLFHIYDVKKKPWVVRVGWHTGERNWGVGVHSVDSSEEWSAGTQVLSFSQVD